MPFFLKNSIQISKLEGSSERKNKTLKNLLQVLFSNVLQYKRFKERVLNTLNLIQLNKLRKKNRLPSFGTSSNLQVWNQFGKCKFKKSILQRLLIKSKKPKLV